MATTKLSDSRIDPTKYLDQVPPGRTATFVIAASDSSPQSKAQADYVCDGVDDQVEIQAAINALPVGGGKVVSLEGTFNIAGDIYHRPNLTLEGQGSTTVFRILAPCHILDYTDPRFSTGMTYIGRLTAQVNVGDTTLTMDTTSGLSPGDNITIWNAYVGDWQKVKTVDSPTQITLEDKSDIEMRGIAGSWIYRGSWPPDENIHIDGIKFYVPAGGLAPGETAYAVCYEYTLNFQLTNCIFINESLGEFRVHNGWDNKYDLRENNFMKGCYLAGWGHLLAKVLNNTAVDCVGESLVGDAQSTIITGNTIIRSSHLFRSHDCSFCVIVGNDLFYGGSILSDEGGESHDCLAANNFCAKGSYAFDLRGYRHSILGNHINDMAADGIWLRSTSFKNRIIGNSILGSAGEAIKDEGTNNTVKDNLGTELTGNKVYQKMKNTSGGDLVAGDVVVFKTGVAAGNEVTTTTTKGDDLVFGMLAEDIVNNATGLIQVAGKTALLKVNGTDDIAIGDTLCTYTEAKIACKANIGDQAFAIALEAYATNDSLGVIDALIVSPLRM